MVSPLSARLLRDYNSLFTKPVAGGNSPSGRKTPFHVRSPTDTSGQSSTVDSIQQVEASSTRSSGYTADVEQPTVSSTTAMTAAAKNKLPISSIDLLPQSVKRRNSGDRLAGTKEEISPKRQRMQELNYMASMVRYDLNHAGVEYPTFQVQSCPSVKILGMDIDMSKVSLVLAKDMAHSPFLYGHQLSPEKKQQLERHNVAMTKDMEKFMGSMVDACACAYMKDDPSGMVDNTDDEPVEESRGTNSSTSSFTDTESDDLNDEPKSATPPPLAEPKTLAEALSVNSNAVLITLGEAPFSVVHANEAFTRLVGMPPSKVVGMELHKLVQGGLPEADGNKNVNDDDDAKVSPLVQALLASAETQTTTDTPNCHTKIVLSGQHFKSKSLCRNFGLVTCKVVVTPLSAPSSQTITHYSMEIMSDSTPTPYPWDNNSSHDPMTSSTCQLALNVMG